MGFTRSELEAARGRSVPDLLGRRVSLLFVGINPGLWTAAAQAHFARRGNRFYPALHRAGLSRRLIDASGGLEPSDAADLTERGIGITNIVDRATARADELALDELRCAAAHLEEKVAGLRPAVVVILGLTAYRAAFGRPGAVAGWQGEELGGARLFVAGNPSGLNAHQSIESLAEELREAAEAAGVV